MGAQGDKWRQHRRAFELARAHNCSLKEAEATLRRDAVLIALRKSRAAENERRARYGLAPIEEPKAAPHEPFDTPWMMRN